jgi:hypothetical protein
VTEYTHCHLSGINAKSSLTNEEEWRLFKKTMPQSLGLLRPMYGPIQVSCYSKVDNCKPFYGDIIVNTESELTLFVDAVSTLDPAPSFPLDRRNIKDTKIGMKMVDDLAESCEVYYKLPIKGMDPRKRRWLGRKRCQTILSEIINKRDEVEEHLIWSINTIPDDIGPD